MKTLKLGLAMIGILLLGYWALTTKEPLVVYTPLEILYIDGLKVTFETKPDTISFKTRKELINYVAEITAEHTLTEGPKALTQAKLNEEIIGEILWNKTNYFIDPI